MAAAIALGGAVTAFAAKPPIRTGQYSVDVKGSRTISCVSEGTAVIIDYGSRAAMGNVVSETAVEGTPWLEESYFNTGEAIDSLFNDIDQRGAADRKDLKAYLVGGNSTDLKQLATELKARGVTDITVQHLDDRGANECYDVIYDPVSNEIQVRQRLIFPE